MIFGAITNSWRHQLESVDLMELVGQAEQIGARHIALRQTCLETRLKSPAVTGWRGG